MPAPRAPWRHAQPCSISCTARCVVQTVGPGAAGGCVCLACTSCHLGGRGVEKGLLLLGQKLLLGGRLLNQLETGIH